MLLFRNNSIGHEYICYLHLLQTLIFVADAFLLLLDLQYHSKCN